jgi:Ca-activated chloride channel family protein
VAVTAAPSAAPARDLAFEAAKTASMQRVATSVSSVDSLSMAQNASFGTTRRAGSHIFVLRDSMWTDAAIGARAQSGQTVRIKAFSKAYFDLIDAVPELRAVFAVGERVTARGRSVTLVVSDSGVEELPAQDVKMIAHNW